MSLSVAAKESQNVSYGVSGIKCTNRESPGDHCFPLAKWCQDHYYHASFVSESVATTIVMTFENTLCERCWEGNGRVIKPFQCTECTENNKGVLNWPAEERDLYAERHSQ